MDKKILQPEGDKKLSASSRLPDFVFFTKWDRLALLGAGSLFTLINILNAANMFRYMRLPATKHLFCLFYAKALYFHKYLIKTVRD